MKAKIFCSLLFVYFYYVCAMQQVRIHEHHRHHSPEVIVIEMPTIQTPAPSPHTEEVRYDRKKKLALIGLATAALAGGTAVIVFLTK